MKKFDQINRDLGSELSCAFERVDRIKKVVNRLDGGVPEVDSGIEKINVEPYSIIDHQESLIKAVCMINSDLEGLAARLENIA